MKKPNVRRRPGHRAPASSRFDPLEPRTLFAAPTVVDVLVVYTAESKTQLGVDDAGIQKLIRQSFANANQVHYNTQDDVVLRLVRVEQVAYSNGGASINTDLDRLRTAGDGFLDAVHTLRDTYGADLVSLISIPPGATAGLANLLDSTTRPDRDTLGFSVLQADALGPDSFVLAHETGHNLGAGHERGNVSDPTPNVVFPYAYGYDFTGSNGAIYRDVMSYRGMELPYFSNPNLTYQGQPLGKPAGDPNAADLYSTFLQTAPIVAAYRPTVVADTIAPAATAYQTNLTGNQLTFTIRYADDVAVNAASLDAGDVYVRTPEGFNLAAALVSLDRAGDGYAKLATYRVTLPASNPPLTSLGFFLNSGQVRDVNDNVAPAAQIPFNSDFDIDRFEYQLARDTGTLTAPTTRRMTGGLASSDIHDYYKFTLTQSTAVSVRLGGLTRPAEIFLMQDVDGNGIFGGGVEQLAGTPNSNTLTDRSFSRVLPAGTYYVLVQLNDPGPALPQPTDYTLTLRGLVDSTPPTATLDTVDITSWPASNVLSFSVIYADDQELDLSSVRTNSIVQIGGLIAGTSGSPSNVTTLPDGRVLATYSIPIGQALPNGPINLSVAPSAAVKDAAGNPLPGGAAIGSFRIAATPVTTDATAPTATLRPTTPVLVPGGTAYEFTVAYRDNRGILAGTLDNGDVVVTGPGGFAQAAQFVSSTPSTGGMFRYATYRITPPGGTWNHSDDGTYSVAVQPSQVTDLGGLAVPATTIGTFTVHAPLPGDANNDDQVNFDDLLALAQNYNTSGVGYGGGDFDYNGVVNFDDLLILAQNYNSSLTPAPAPAPVLAEPVAALVFAADEDVVPMGTADDVKSTKDEDGFRFSRNRIESDRKTWKPRKGVA